VVLGIELRLYHLSYTPSPFYFSHFAARDSHFCLGLTWIKSFCLHLPHSWMTDMLPCLIYLLRWNLANILSRPARIQYPPNLCLLSKWDLDVRHHIWPYSFSIWDALEEVMATIKFHYNLSVDWKSENMVRMSNVSVYICVCVYIYIYIYIYIHTYIYTHIR
jgi:hypothetical protein